MSDEPDFLPMGRKVWIVQAGALTDPWIFDYARAGDVVHLSALASVRDIQLSRLPSNKFYPIEDEL